jgi:hypothetical protein
LVVELPELEPLEPEPMLPLPLELPAPVPGEVVPGEVVLGEVGAGALVALPLLLPEAPVPALDLLKWESHSEREIWPSLFVSTAEKLGAEALLALLPDIPPLDDEDLSLLVLDEELCARATPDSANSAAAVAALRIFRFNMP